MARPDIGATLGAPAVWAQYLGGATVREVGALSVEVTTLEPIADLLDVIAAGPVLPPPALARLMSTAKGVWHGQGGVARLRGCSHARLTRLG